MAKIKNSDPITEAETDSKLLEWMKAILRDQPIAVADFAAGIGDNPGRISRAYRNMLSGYFANPSEILKVTLDVPGADYNGLVASKGIPFLSFCSHHFLPFFGSVDIIYEPGPHIIGIGKMPRLVDCRAKRFQLQELLVRQIAEDMTEHAKAKGVYVRSTARHACVCYRGPEHPTTVNTTTYAAGTLCAPSRMTEIQAVLVDATSAKG